MSAPLLEVRDLSISFGKVEVVDRLSLSIARGESLGLVGESGCGKSVTSLAVMGLLPARGCAVRGNIRLDGQELTSLSREEWRYVRGGRVAMVFQDPMTALDPLMTVGGHLAEVLSLHRGLSGAALRTEAASWLERVEIGRAHV